MFYFYETQHSKQKTSTIIPIQGLQWMGIFLQEAMSKTDYQHPHITYNIIFYFFAAGIKTKNEKFRS